MAGRLHLKSMPFKRIVRYTPGNHSLPEEQEIHPLLKRIYAHRNIQSSAELDKSLNKLLPFQLLKGIEEATTLLANALKDSDRIIVIGDFDADGATSTTVAVKALRMLGASDVHFLVPNRFEYGYGLTPEIVREAAKIKPDLIVTVDNGIANIDGVDQARELGIKVLITDHHLAGDQLPQANAIVNPNQPGCKFPAKSTAGVGVIFYVMLALRAKLRDSGWFTSLNIAEPNLASLLDIVALGTVADVVPLEHNNRILVAQGIRRIRAGHVCPGIQALLEVSGKNPRATNASDFGFAIGPRLNAAGRLEDMSIGIQCLLSESMPEARLLAEQLHELNIERKKIEQEMQGQAVVTIETLQLDKDGKTPFGIAIYDPEWHQGVIGILASRIKERYHRPTIVFAKADDEVIKGSARSVPGIHIRDVLDLMSKRQPDLIIKFGGHAMAAGLSIELQKLDRFAVLFDKLISELVDNEEITGTIHSDGELESENFDLQIAQLLRDAEPWGQSFPEPVFDGYFTIVEQRIVGEKHLKLRLQAENQFSAMEAIAFNVIDSGSPSPYRNGDNVHAAFKLDVNEFRGQRTLQLMIEQLQNASDAVIE